MRLAFFNLVAFLLFFPNIVHAKNLKDVAVVLTTEKSCFDMAKEMNNQAINILRLEDNPQSIWSITLYETQADVDKIEEMISELRKVKIPKFSIMLSKVKNDADSVLSFDILKNDKLLSLHKLVVHIVMGYSTGPIKRAKDGYKNLSNEAKRQVDRYGSFGVLSDYKPKLPFFYSIDTNPALKDGLLEIEKSAPTDVLCRINEIAIGETDYYGNIKSILKSIAI